MKKEEQKETKEKEIKYGPAVIECACGNKFETGSTVPYIKVEICSACHPFYTGKQKLVDTAGRVDRFKEKVAKAEAAKVAKKKEVKEDKEATDVTEVTDVTEDKNAAEVTEVTKEEKAEEANQ